MTGKNITTALLVAVVVGTVLNLINSSDIFLENRFTGRNILKIILTYIIPFCVSLYAALKATKHKA